MSVEAPAIDSAVLYHPDNLGAVASLAGSLGRAIGTTIDMGFYTASLLGSGGSLGPNIDLIGTKPLGLGPRGGISSISEIVNEGPVFTQPRTLTNFSLLDEAGKIAYRGWNGSEPGVAENPVRVRILEPKKFTEISLLPIPVKEKPKEEEKVKTIWEEIRAQQVSADGDFDRAFRAATALGIPASRFGWEEPLVQAAASVKSAESTGVGLKQSELQQSSSEVVQYSRSEPAVSTQTLPVSIPLPQPRLVEQVLQEYALRLDDRRSETFDTRQLEEVEEITARYVEDTAVSEQRKHEVSEAIKKARAEIEAELAKNEPLSADTNEKGEVEIEGWRIIRFVPLQHAGNESQIVRNTNHLDGSLAETYEELASRRFKSERDASKKSASIIDRIKPVKKTKKGGGNIVSETDIARVHKYDVVKSHPAYEVVARIVRKQIFETKVGQKSSLDVPEIEKREEIRVEDDPTLAEVFQLAA